MANVKLCFTLLQLAVTQYRECECDQPCQDKDQQMTNMSTDLMEHVQATSDLDDAKSSSVLPSTIFGLTDALY